MISGKKNLRLLYVSEGNIPSRAANSIQVMKMSQALARQVEEFELVTLGDERSEKIDEVFDFQKWYGLGHPFRIVRLPLLPEASYPFQPNYRHPEWGKRAAEYAVSRAPDAVITRSPEVSALLAHRGVPVLFEYHLPIDEMPFFREPENLGQNPNLVGWITIHENLFESGDRAGIPRDKILVCPDAADIDLFTPMRSKAEARRTLGWETQRKIALYCGHLYDGRGVDHILRCAKCVPEAEFVFVGGWDHDIERWKTEAEKLSLGNVHFEGFVENTRVPSYLFSADALLMPHSASYMWVKTMSPLKLFEYMAAGRPILATDIEIFKPLLENGRNACLSPPDDPDALAKNLRKIFSNPKWAEHLGENARADVVNLTWDKRAEKILDHLEARLVQRGRP